MGNQGSLWLEIRPPACGCSSREGACKQPAVCPHQAWWVPGLHNCPTLPTWVSSGALALLFPWRPECTLIPLSRAFRWGRLKHSTTSSFWTAAANLFSPSIEPSVRPFWDVKPEAPHTWDELERQWKRLLLSQFMLRCPHSSAGLTPQPAKHTQPTIWGRSSPYCWYHKGSEGPWHLAGCASRCCQTQGCWGTLAGRWGEPALGWAWASQRPAVPENTVGACSSCLLSEPAASTSSWTFTQTHKDKPHKCLVPPVRNPSEKHQQLAAPVAWHSWGSALSDNYLFCLLFILPSGITQYSGELEFQKHLNNRYVSLFQFINGETEAPVYSTETLIHPVPEAAHRSTSSVPNPFT